MRLLFGIIGLVMGIIGIGQEVTINEFMASNATSIVDEDGDYSDWIELYNSGNTTIDLGGWYLSDDPDIQLKWEIEEAEIGPGQFLLVFASDKDRTGPGELHANFKISSGGEMLLLTNAAGELQQYIPPVALATNMSYGSLIDGQTDTQGYFQPASPGEANDEGNQTLAITDEITFSRQGGFYGEEFSLELNSAEGSEIRYTLDGSEPTANSILYEAPLSIVDRIGQPNGISEIETGILWEPPRSEVEKATVVKAASFVNAQRTSPVCTESYFISERIDQRYDNIPVVSLSTHPDSLFSYERGIYVPGRHFDPSWDTGTGNFYQRGRDWERQIHFEYYDDEHQKQLGQDVGARIHGNSSRHYSQKTLRLYARSEYGDADIDYQFFADKEIDSFKRILLRSSSTDFGNTMFKDILCAQLVRGMDMDYMAAKVCAVYVNGEYWGISSFRERIDEHFLAANHGVDPDALDLLALNAEVEQGDAEDYYQLLDYVRNNDLSAEQHFDYVSERLDISNFIDYNITQMMLANFDWPATNIRFWKGGEEGAKWRWIFYDCDRCMILPDHDQLENYVQADNQYNNSPEWTILLFNRLLRNEDFKAAFVQRFFYLLNTELRAERMLQQLDSLEALYTPLVVEHINRWGYPASVNDWTESLIELRGFILKRPAVMVQQVMDYIGEQYVIYPNPVAAGTPAVSLDMTYSEGVDVSLRLFTSQGQELSSFRLDSQNQEQHPIIPISDLSPGLYILQIQYGSLLFSEKLIVD